MKKLFLLAASVLALSLIGVLLECFSFGALFAMLQSHPLLSRHLSLESLAVLVAAGIIARFIVQWRQHIFSVRLQLGSETFLRKRCHANFSRASVRDLSDEGHGKLINLFLVQ